MNKIQMLSQGNYMTIVKPLAHEIGLNETVTLMELVGLHPIKRQKQLDFMGFSKENGTKLDPNKMVFCFEDNSFRCTHDEFEMETTLSRKKQDRAFSNLEKLGLITKTLKGLPSKRFITLHNEAIEELIDKCHENYAKFKEEFYNERREKRKKENEAQREKQRIKNQEKIQSDKMKTQIEPLLQTGCPKGTIKNEPEGQSRMNQKDNQECPKGTTINNVLSNTVFINNVLGNNEITSSSSSNNKIEEEEEDLKDNIFFLTLFDYLIDKGLSEKITNKTIKKLKEKGITQFTMSEIERAFEKLVRHNAVERVSYPHSFFSNGLEQEIEMRAIDRSYEEMLQQLQEERESYKNRGTNGKIEFFDWLNQEAL